MVTPTIPWIKLVTCKTKSSIPKFQLSKWLMKGSLWVRTGIYQVYIPWILQLYIQYICMYACEGREKFMYLYITSNSCEIQIYFPTLLHFNTFCCSWKDSSLPRELSKPCIRSSYNSVMRLWKISAASMTISWVLGWVGSKETYNYQQQKLFHY